jgi:transcriptional regulator with XRE-family HTH domain
MRWATHDEVLARFADNVATLRLGRGLKQEQLATMAMVSWAQIACLENRERSPRLPTIVSLAGVLEVPVSTLFAGISFTATITTPGGFVVDPKPAPPGRRDR